MYSGGVELPGGCQLMATQKPQQAPYELFSDLPDVMTSKEVAGALGICEKKVRTMAIMGELTGIKIGSVWRFSKTSLIAFVEGRIDER